MLSARPIKPADSDVGTLVPLEPPAQLGLAVYVVGAPDGARFPLPLAGSVTIGRDAGCEIVLNHPMVSRRHATIHVGETLLLEDLGSANGTTVGKQRLAAGGRQPLDVDQSFLIGSTALILHQHRLPTSTSVRLATPTQLLERIDNQDTGFSLIKLSLERSVELRWIETILATTLDRDDLLVPLRGSEVAVLVANASADQASARLNACLDELRRWQIPATGDARSFVESEPAGATAAQFLFAGHKLLTQRGSVVVSDPAMFELHRVIERIAPTRVNVLILGETGVGKDVIASLIHERSPRHDQPFLRMNCATLSESLFESELFGHEKGAFTGAIRTKVGLLETANGGTVFLDEVGEMAPASQAKLLRVLDNGVLTRVGGTRGIPIDVRFLAATNRDLEQEVSQGTFRRDLYYRLNTVQIQVPALRARPAEILPLALHFLTEATRNFGLSPISFSPASLEALKAYDWPGSIRQLRNVVERSALLGRGSVLEPEDLGLPRAGQAVAQTTGNDAGTNDDVAKNDSMRSAAPQLPVDDECRRITEALQACNGNQTRAAVLLKMSRRTLVRKLTQYALPRPHGPFHDEP